MPEQDRGSMVERENPMPNFSFEVFYGAHGSAQHIMATDAVLEEFKMIYKSGKPIVFVDVPVGHPLVNRFLQLMTSGFKINRDFDQTLKNVKSHLQTVASIDVERENYILAHLQRTIEQVAEATPALQSRLPKKRKVNALLFLGANHTRVYDELKDSGFDVRATYSHYPFLYSFSQETVRRYVYGEDVDDEQAAKSYVDMIVLQPWLQGITRDFSKVSQYIRRALSGFALDEIRMLFEEGKKGNSDVFAHLLTEKGIAIPQTEHELNVFLYKSK